ncbi:Ubx2p NDAI_0C00980 [Naumovozyma dairenensis CBS 421]|uniref:UBX domain-containing protein n=1 Tax=Naumovozyma dairenensis (strain ATCC 10597 / BCRC 20456 / CBS 421 / NBRC 0211 / NRRL Y-12639) TaxID=1071378 RepID=G0W7J8_NAUDC|nr:hypothetical protein NDAI_0C00980 [Naumovozyma dairenensis CBS 421]CCD23759.1 hypothetical protein NDAI_0C00980 [Naumovozyma dairenensis CBS 421]
MGQQSKTDSTRYKKKRRTITQIMPIITSGAQEFHLSHEEEDKLNEFQTITNFPEDEIPNIIKLLQNNGWNLEISLSRYFDNDWKESLNAPPVPSHPLASPPLPVDDNLNQALPLRPAANDFNPFPFIPQLRLISKLPLGFKEKYRMIGLQPTAKSSLSSTNPLIFMLMILPNLIFKLGSFIWSLLTMGLFKGKEEKANNVIGEGKYRICSIPKNPQYVEFNEIQKNKLKMIVDDFTALADEKKDNNSSLICWDLSFNEFLDVCKNEFKFGLIVLVGDLLGKTEEENEKLEGIEEISVDNESQQIDMNSQLFVDKILNDERIVQLLRSHSDDLIVYFGSVVELETWLIAKQLNLKYTPECLLIGNVMNGNGNVTKLSILSKLKVTTVKRFTKSFNSAVAKYQPELVISRNEKNELDLARQIKLSQEEAYENSLKQDQLKEQQKEMERQTMELMKRKEEMMKIEESYKHVKWLHSCLQILEDDYSKKPEGSEPQKMATLQIRTSQGTRLVRKFDSRATLHDIYINIGCHLFLDNHSLDLNEWTKSIVDKIKNLSDNDTVLCFKDREIIEDEIIDDANELRAIINEELIKWESQLIGNSEMHGDMETFELDFDFELVSPFPRFIVPTDKNMTVKEVTQLWPNGSLLVEKIAAAEEDEEEEEELEN